MFRVQDTTPPVIAVPAILVQIADAANGSVVSYVVTADDAVDSSSSVSCTPSSGSLFALGNTTVVCSSTDTHGNGSSETFTVTVSLCFGGFERPFFNPPFLSVCWCQCSSVVAATAQRSRTSTPRSGSPATAAPVSSVPSGPPRPCGCSTWGTNFGSSTA